MSLPWHVPLEGLETKNKAEEITQPSLLQHYCNLDINKEPYEEVQTGIMCEIGVQNREPSTIQRLIASGMTIARLNLRDVEPELCGQLIQSIRQAVYNYSSEMDFVYPLAIAVDVRDPDILTGELKGGPRTTVDLVENETIKLTTDAGWRSSGTAECLYIGWDRLTELNTGDSIYISSLTQGPIKLVVTEVGADSIECIITESGTIGAKMAVRISQMPKDVADPGKGAQGDSNLSIVCTEASQESMEHLEKQVAWAIASDVDAVLVPGAQTVYDVKQVREMLAPKGKHVLIIACIETLLGFDNVDEILDEADGLYLDRSVLSVDLPIEKIFIAQKTILAKCNKRGKPCVCKTVINEQIPTLCVTDMANLILDGVDVIALELHYDSPLKKFASTDAVRMAEHCLGATTVISRQAERIAYQPQVYGNLELMQSPLEEPSRAVCVSAVELGMRSRAVVIICITNSGRTAKLIAHSRPHCPIVAVTRTCHVARQLRFWRGIRTVHYFDNPKASWSLETDARVHAALEYCKARRMIRAGDAYVVVSSSRRGAGYTDMLRLLYATARDIIPVD